MRCRSYRAWWDALDRNLKADYALPPRDKQYVIDYKKNTINRVIDSDKKDNTISISP